MPKSTPGPWEQRGKRVYATGYVDTFSGPVIGAIAYCEETTQTDCEGRTWYVNGDALANARLIAAAPDMLEALKALLACPAIADGGLSDPEWGCQESAEAVTKARAAIDKAEGDANG